MQIELLKIKQENLGLNKKILKMLSRELFFYIRPSKKDTKIKKTSPERETKD